MTDQQRQRLLALERKIRAFGVMHPSDLAVLIEWADEILDVIDGPPMPLPEAPK